MNHLKAWNKEYKQNIWKGHYSLRMLDVDKKGNILDAGCGSGKYTLPLKMQGFDVIGIDISQEALKIAHKSSKMRKLDIKFIASNIYCTPFFDSSFDVVWCYGVLQHLLLKEREQTINEFLRILKKEGLLFLEVFGKEDMRYGGIEVEKDTFSRESGIVYHYFNKVELENLLKDFSYKIEESKKEKLFNGKYYMRHLISVVAKKM